ncbi:unnamed protein product, partial [Closterium sp. Naga37s-1]
KLSDNRLTGTIPAVITALTNLLSLHLDSNQLAGELPSFHHMARLTSLEAQHNYLTATADQLFLNAQGEDDPAEYYSMCLFHHNCLEDNSLFCYSDQAHRRDSECRAFCGAQPLTPPCSGHGVCSSFVPDLSHEMTACCVEEYQTPPPYYQPKGQCDCDEGYTPGTAAGTCVPHVPVRLLHQFPSPLHTSPPPTPPALLIPTASTNPVPCSFHNPPCEPPETSAMGVALALLQQPQNRLLLLVVLPLAVLQLAFALPLLLRRIKHRHPTRYL